MTFSRHLIGSPVTGISLQANPAQLGGTQRTEPFAVGHYQLLHSARLYQADDVVRARSRSTSTRLNIFPAGLFGISVTNSTSLIRLCGATRAETNSIISAAVAADLSTTNALGTSPASSSGLGITPASAIAGCKSRTASSSAGAT